MTSEDQTAPIPTSKPKSKLGIYLLVAAWAGAWALVIAQIVTPIG